MISNCLLMACLHWLRHPASTTIIPVVNASGRIHWVWERHGKRYEFYAKGRSKLPYWRNVLYRGRVLRYMAPVSKAQRPQ